jgi:hypothetical protein
MEAVVYSGPGDGQIGSSANSWAATRAGEGSLFAATEELTVISSVDIDEVGGIWNISRIGLPFDLSAIPAGSTITAATLRLTAPPILQEWSDSAYLVLVGTEQANPAALATADWSTFGDTAFTTPTEVVNEGYLDEGPPPHVYNIALNAAGLAALAAACGGWAKLGLMTQDDFNVVDPGEISTIAIISSQEYTGTNYDPMLTITYNLNAPGAPTIGEATAGDGQASVAFTPPANNGGSEITSYTVTAVEDPTKTATGTESPIVVQGLENGTQYTFKVTATNAIGTGAESETSNPITPTAAPPTVIGILGSFITGGIIGPGGL